MRRLVVCAVAIGALTASCSDSDDASTTTTEVDTTTTVSTTMPPSSTTTTTTTTPASTSTTAPETTTSSAPSTTSTTLAGEPIELFAQPGQAWSVVGVDREDVLNVRAGPGVGADIVATLAPTADGVVTTGRARALPRSIWYEVDVDGTVGWVNISFLALPGVVDDLTSQVEAALGGLPSAETLVDLALVTGGVFASEEPPSDLVISVAPSLGDLAEITVDVMGLADDAQVGWRLHLFAVEDDGGESFTLRTVEATALCGRGVDDQLRCA